MSNKNQNKKTQPLTADEQVKELCPNGVMPLEDFRQMIMKDFFEEE